MKIISDPIPPLKQIRKQKLLGTRVYWLSVQLNLFTITFKISPSASIVYQAYVIQLSLQLISDHTFLTLYTLVNQICFHSLHEDSILPLQTFADNNTALESHFYFFSFINSTPLLRPYSIITSSKKSSLFSPIWVRCSLFPTSFVFYPLTSALCYSGMSMLSFFLREELGFIHLSILFA